MLEEARLQDDNKGRKMACTSHAPKTRLGLMYVPSVSSDRRAFRLNRSLNEKKKKNSEWLAGSLMAGETLIPPESEFTVMKEKRRPSSSFRHKVTSIRNAGFKEPPDLVIAAPPTSHHPPFTLPSVSKAHWQFKHIKKWDSYRNKHFYFIIQIATYELYYLPKGAEKHHIPVANKSHSLC